ncbi:MAG: cation:proton antiporter [Zoogloeaceae bacterium]|jgi:CPA2 family monovalent cation:H+ antiporter-2|nr:cation:proton antiporter [Zoogloeaceae bacterium]
MHEGLRIVLLLLTASVVMVALARAARLPSILAYLVIGVAIGPHALGWLQESEQAERLAEFGVVFLMFSIGLEFSLPRLLSMRWQVFGLGGAQVAVTMLATMLFGLAAGIPWQGGLALGAIYAMSSTAIVGHLLAEKLDLHSASGRRTMSVLLFQDLMVVFMLILIPALVDTSHLAEALGKALAQTLVVLLLVTVAGRPLIRRWFDLVVRRKSTELFMLNVLWITIALAFLTELAGLSLTLGAFLGGMLISETMYRHQVEADIRPFRDVLLGLFFITVGAHLDFALVWQYIEWVALVLFGLVIGKGLLMLIVARLAGADTPVAFRTAAQLAQAGEFGFVLLTLASAHGLLTPEVVHPSLAGMLLSMLAAPFIIERARAIGDRLLRDEWLRHAAALQEVATHAFGIRDHAIICGYGRAGQSVARFLAKEKIPFIALDMDGHRVQQALTDGENVVFGNAERREVLLAAGLERARIVVVTLTDVSAAIKVLGIVRSRRPELPVVARAVDDGPLDELKRAGATEVVPEVMEGSLMLAAQTLTRLGVPLRRVLRDITDARAKRYELLRERYHEIVEPLLVAEEDEV